jgi:hypothetical protein
MTKSKGIGRGGARKGSGRPRFAKSGKTSYFSTRLTPKTRDLLETEARRRGESLSIVAEDILQLGLEEVAALQKSRPLRGLLFLIEMLEVLGRIPNWRTDPQEFANFRAGVLGLLDELRPPGELTQAHARPLGLERVNYLVEMVLLNALLQETAESRGLEEFKSRLSPRLHYGFVDAYRDLNLGPSLGRPK